MVSANSRRLGRRRKLKVFGGQKTVDSYDSAEDQSFVVSRTMDILTPTIVPTKEDAQDAMEITDTRSAWWDMLEKLTVADVMTQRNVVAVKRSVSTPHHPYIIYIIILFS